MKITNRSGLTMDEDTWRDIARSLHIDHLDTKDIRRQDELRVIVGKRRTPGRDQQALYGFHVPREIVILTCGSCTSGTIFLTYLHELMHEWLNRKHPDTYHESWTELFCEGVARSMFELFGGTSTDEPGCSKWLIPSPLPPIRSAVGFDTVAEELNRSSPRQLREMAQKYETSFRLSNR